MENQFEEIKNKLDLISGKLDELVVLPKEATMLSFQEACEFVKLSHQTLYSKVSKKQIPFHKRGNRLWFDRNELVAWLKSEGSS